MKLLIDSDFLFGLFVDADAHHKSAIDIFKKIQDNNHELVVLNLVIQETATVISNKRSQRDAVLFSTQVRKMPFKIMNIDVQNENLAWQIFKKQTKKGTSFIDCANLATYQKYKLDGILSFDEFYPKTIRFV